MPLLIVAIGLGFGLLVLLVRLHLEPVTNVDRGVARELNEVVSPRPYLVNALNGTTRLGGRPVRLWLVGIAALLLLMRRRVRLAVYLLATTAGALLLDPSVKSLVGRLRPVTEAPVAIAPGNSFPSGHALGSMVVFDRATVRDAAAAWTVRVNTVTARTDRVDVDTLLIRPDGCVAWALSAGQDPDAATLVRALGTWFGPSA